MPDNAADLSVPILDRKKRRSAPRPCMYTGTVQCPCVDLIIFTFVIFFSAWDESCPCFQAEERLAEKRTPLIKPPPIKTEAEKDALRNKMKDKVIVFKIIFLCHFLYVFFCNKILKV